MAILIDYNHVFLANLFAQVYSTPGEPAAIDEPLIRHTVLSNLLHYKKTYEGEYGSLVICADGGNCWRKKHFPYYKAARKKQREESSLDWNMVYESMHKIRSEIRDNFPYKVLIMDTAEADDIISVLARNLCATQNIMIISSDKDFIQLQKYPNVKQYSPIHKRLLSHDDPDLFLKEKILSGDAGDGVPNFLSDGDTFVVPGKRQKPLRAKILSEHLAKDLDAFDEKYRKNYERNRVLVDLINCVPSDLEEKILQQFDSQNPKNNVLEYFMKNKLRNLMPSLMEF